MIYYYINNNFFKAQSLDNKFDWVLINYFYKPVDNDKNWVIIVIFLIYQN